MRPFVLSLLAVASLAGAAPANGTATWTRARSARFEVLTDGGGEAARQIATALERFRLVLASLYGPIDPGAEGPVIVLALADRTAFEETVPLYRGRRVAADGFFQGGSDGTYVVLPLATARADPLEIAFHEYTHVFLSHRLAAQPPWVAEGLADLLSTWQAEGEKVILGRALPSHRRVLREESWIPLPELLRIGYASTAYNEGEHRDLLYAESWALLHHWLIGRAADLTALLPFLDAVAEGGDAPASFARAFGEDPARAQEGLRTYLLPESLPTVEVTVAGLGAVVSPPAVEAVSAAEIDYRAGDLLLAQGRLDEGMARLSRALGADPRLAAAHARLAWASLRRRKPQEAERHLQAALAASPDDPRVLYGYADALVQEAGRRGEVLSDAATDAAVAALEKAVAVAPQLADAVELLARLRPLPLDHRIALLERAFAADRSRTSLAITLVGLYLKKNDFSRARTLLARARQDSRDEDLRFLCAHLLGKIGEITAVTAEVKGVLSSLRCLPSGALRFVVQAQGRSLQLHADSPLAVLLYGADGQPFQKTLLCGPQDVPVTAWYRTPPEIRPPGTDGLLLSLTFSGKPPKH